MFGEWTSDDEDVERRLRLRRRIRAVCRGVEGAAADSFDLD